MDDKGRWHNRTRRKGFATMRYTISGIPKAMVPTHLLYRVEHYVSGLLQLLEIRVCRVPLSPKWATPGLGSDFAISPWVVVCNHSNTLYLFDPCDSDTDAVVTNPHTIKCTEHNCPANTTDPISTAEGAHVRLGRESEEKGEGDENGRYGTRTGEGDENGR